MVPRYQNSSPSLDWIRVWIGDGNDESGQRNQNNDKNILASIYLSKIKAQPKI